MRIGELAALLGVSTRTVRHYHHQGVLPEPARRANGYRTYGMRDAVALARVRRLVRLGLSLDEVRDVIADDRARDLPDILRDIDADLARQEADIRARRAHLARLLDRSADGLLEADDTASPELVAFLTGIDAPASRTAAWDRDVLMVIDTLAPHESGTSGMFAALPDDLELAELSRDLYLRLDDLAGAGSDDPRIAELAAEIVDFTTAHLRVDLSGDGPDWDPAALDPFLAELDPAQAEAVRRAVRLLAERDRRPPPPAAEERP